mgnify:CR=1 FL=1
MLITVYVIETRQNAVLKSILLSTLLNLGLSNIGKKYSVYASHVFSVEL